MRRQSSNSTLCNAISKKAVYDQLFIDTIVMGSGEEARELSNILVKSS